MKASPSQAATLLAARAEDVMQSTVTTTATRPISSHSDPGVVAHRRIPWHPTVPPSHSAEDERTGNPAPTRGPGSCRKARECRPWRRPVSAPEAPQAHPSREQDCQPHPEAVKGPADATTQAPSRPGKGGEPTPNATALLTWLGRGAESGTTGLRSDLAEWIKKRCRLKP